MKKFFLIPLVALFCSISAWADDDAVATILEEGKAEVKATSLTDLNTKIEVLTNPATVTLLKSVNISDPTQAVTFHVPVGKNVTLNLNGYNIIQTFTIKDNGTDYMAFGDFAFGGFGDINENALIYNEGTLHIVSEGSSIVQMISAASPAGSATTICNGNPSEGKAYLTIDGGIFTGPIGRIPEMGWTLKLPVIWSMGTNSEITINGGTFLCDESRSDYAMGPIFGPISGGGTWNIKGGIFSTSDEVYRVADGYATKTDHKSTKDHWLTSTTGKALQEGYEAIDVPYTNANITGYHDRVVANEHDDVTKPGYLNPKKVCAVVPKTNRYEVTANTETVGNADYNFVYVDPGKTLTIMDGHTVKVGDAGVILGGTDSKIIIEAGGTLVSDGDIITSSNDNIELTMDAAYKEKGKVVGKYAHLLIKAGNIQAKHPNATVNLKSVCKNLNTWQRFAIPTYQSDFTIADIERPAGVGTAFFKWQYDGEDGNWVQLTSSAAVLEPFHGYIMTNNASEDGKIYTFKGELVGNGNPRLSLQNGWNYFANSYTAPISVEAMLVGMKEKLDGEAAVWVQRNGAKNTWSDIAFADIKDGGINEALLLLQPMNTFVFKASAVSTFDLEYDDFVYTPVKSAKGFAPRRAQAAAQDEDYKMAIIVLTDEEEDEELLRLYEGNDFSDSFDNGYDVSKMPNEEIFNAYFVSPALGNLSRLASDNVDNSSITLDTKETTHFTLSFRNVSLEGYSLKDNVADSLITIQTGETYEFEAEANTKYEGRFTVVKNGGETAIDNVEETKYIANGIYSVTGVYMGNNINLLPAGIYIINGKKVVK